MTNLKNIICNIFDKDAEQVARFYAKVFPNSSIGLVHKAPVDYPMGKAGKVLIVEFIAAGIPCVGVHKGGQESMCGWYNDKRGVSWQTTPRSLTEAMSKGGDEAKRAFEAMMKLKMKMKMKQIDVAAINATRKG